MKEAIFLSHSGMEYQVAFPILVFKESFIVFYIYKCSTYMYIYLMNVSMQGRRVLQVIWNWSYR